jgi:hypothetical protein
VVAEAGDLRAFWRELQGAPLSPSAVDLLPPHRVALLFEGGDAAVDRQVRACPRGRIEDRSIWQESAARQQRAGARVAFDWQECLLARPGTGLAWVEAAEARPWPPLAERVRAAFDPDGVLA